MQFRLTAENLELLRQGHQHAVSSFIEALHILDRSQPVHAENDRLEEVARNAERLARSLVALIEFGDASSRMVHQVKSNPSAYQGKKGRTLTNLVEPRLYNPFQHFNGILSDLWACAERAQVRSEPSASEKTASLRAAISSRDPGSLARMVQSSKLPSSYQIPEGAKLHRPKGKPYLVLIESFASTWAALGAGTYSAGHTVKGLGAPKSRAVDALFLIAQRLHPSVKRSSITTAFRDWEKSRRQTSQDLGEDLAKS